MGLTTARQRPRSGATVTLYACELTPHTTSHQSLATLTVEADVTDAILDVHAAAMSF